MSNLFLIKLPSAIAGDSRKQSYLEAAGVLKNLSHSQEFYDLIYRSAQYNHHGYNLVIGIYFQCNLWAPSPSSLINYPFQASRALLLYPGYTSISTTSVHMNSNRLLYLSIFLDHFLFNTLFSLSHALAPICFPMWKLVKPINQVYYSSQEAYSWNGKWLKEEQFINTKIINGSHLLYI